MKKLLTLLFIMVLCMHIFGIKPYSVLKVQAAPDEETRSPTSEEGYWTDAGYAYTSNDSYAQGFTRNSVNEWGDYGFSLSGVDIDEVLVGVEHYVAASYYSIQVAVYDGSDWSAWSPYYIYEAETMLWLDYTDIFDWTAEKVNAIRTKVIHRMAGGGGCYPNNMYFVVIENASLLGSELLDITDWQFYNPRQIQEALDENRTLYVLSWNDVEGWFVNEDSEIVEVQEHDEGNYTLYDIYSGVMDIDYTDEDGKNKTVKWESHIELTSNHELLYSLDGDYWLLDTSESLYNNFENGETVYMNHLWWNYTLKPFPVTDVKVTKRFKEKVYNVLTKADAEYTPDKPIHYKKGKTLSDQEYDMLMHLKTCGVPIGQFPPFLSITAKIPLTAYLDWIPVKVTYSEAEEEEWVDCQYIGVNNTIAGEPTLFTSNWTDIHAAEGLDFWCYSTNRSGSWVNSSWSDTWRSTVCADYTDTLGSTEYNEYFRFFINDTSGTEYASTICHFPTHLAVEDETYIWFTLALCAIPVGVAFAAVLRKRSEKRRSMQPQS